jgi:hypothetical protein
LIDFRDQIGKKKVKIIVVFVGFGVLEKRISRFSFGRNQSVSKRRFKLFMNRLAGGFSSLVQKEIDREKEIERKRETEQIGFRWEKDRKEKLHQLEM